MLPRAAHASRSTLPASLKPHAPARSIFVSVDENEDSRLNSHEFVALLAILHILKGPEDEEKVDPTILKASPGVADAGPTPGEAARGRLARGGLASDPQALQLLQLPAAEN